MLSMNENVKAEKAPRSVRSDIYDWLQCIVMAIVICVLFFSFIVRLVDVVGSSMYPTLEDGDKIIVSNLFYTPKQGDIVVFRKDEYREEPLVKRIIAVEGQTVDILYDGNGYGTVYVDGEPLDEPYILEPMVLPYYDRTSFPLTVDEGCLVVMGDNRNRSADSRYASIGQIEKSQVIGKVLCILFPGCGESSSRDFGRIGALDNG